MVVESTYRQTPFHAKKHLLDKKIYFCIASTQDKLDLIDGDQFNKKRSYYSYFTSCETLKQDQNFFSLPNIAGQLNQKPDGETLFGMVKFEEVPVLQSGFDILSEALSEHTHEDDSRRSEEFNQVKVTILTQQDFGVRSEQMANYKLW